MEQTKQNDTLPDRPYTIEWQTESSESRTEQVSPDGRWHLDTKVERDGKRKMYLLNHDILCIPMGSGDTPSECWRNFISSCGEYARKLDAIRAEAAVIISNLEKQPTPGRPQSAGR